MAGTRHTLIALLAVSVLAVGCGGDDPAEEDPQPTESEVSTSDGDEPTTTASDSAEHPEETDIDAAPEREPQPVTVQLGDRFPWCADFRRDWDEQTRLQAQANAAEAALRDALDATEAATDELDQAEAVQAFVAAEQHYADLMPAVAAANRAAVRPVQPDWSTHEETEAIAVERAQEDFRLAAAPALLELLETAHAAGAAVGEPQVSTTTRPPQEGDLPGHDEVLATLQQIQNQIDEWWQQSIGVQEAMRYALSGIHAAQNPRAALDAHQRFLEAAQTQDDLYLMAWETNLVSGDIYRVYRLGLGAAQEAGEISHEEHDNRITAAHEIRDITDRTATDIGFIFHDTDGWVDRHKFRSLARRALEAAADRFILADPAWAAFQRSLSESCKP